MKIGFSAFVLQGGRSGVAAYVTNLLDALQRVDRVNTYDILMPRSELGLIPVHSPNVTKIPISDALSRPVPNILWHNTALPRRCRAAGYDLVHVPSYRRLPWVKATRVVATVHDLATFHIEGKYDAARMFYNRRLVPALIRRADHVITVSRFTADDIVRLTGYPAEKITVIYSGINRALYRPVPLAESRARLAERHGIRGPYIVYVSRIEHPAKNHVRLIRAFERLQAARPAGLKLVLAGADWNGAEAVKACAAASPAAADILFTGFVPPEDMALLYSACELMVYPSLFEGFGFPIVEALACGAPVTCSNTSSMLEIGAGLVPKFNPLSEAEMAAFMESELARGRSPERAARGVAYAAGFDWDDTARKVLAVYQQVAEA